jgi:hypothetical protein
LATREGGDGTHGSKEAQITQEVEQEGKEEVEEEVTRKSLRSLFPLLPWVLPHARLRAAASPAQTPVYIWDAFAATG